MSLKSYVFLPPSYVGFELVPGFNWDSVVQTTAQVAGMHSRTDTQTHRQTPVITIHLASTTPHGKYYIQLYSSYNDSDNANIRMNKRKEERKKENNIIC